MITRKTSNLFQFDYEFATTLSGGLYRCYRLKTIRDRFDNDMHFTYNGNGQLTQIQDTEDRNYYLFYDPTSGYLERLSDAANGEGRTIDYHVDECGDLVEVEEFPQEPENDELYRKAQYTYVHGNQGSTHRLYTAKAPREVASSGNPYLINAYDANGRVYAQQYGSGYHVFIYYLSQSGAVSSLWFFDRSNNRTDMTFEAAGGLLASVTRHDGNNVYTTSYEYNNGRLATIHYPAADPIGAPEVHRQERFYYVPGTHPLTRGNLTSLVVVPATTAAQETDLVWQYGPYDNLWIDTPVYQKDSDGYETLTTIAVSNQGDYTVTRTFKKQNEAIQSTTITLLDPYGRVTAVTNPESEAATLTYDGTSGRVTAVFGSEGNTENPIVSMTYDTCGNLLTQTDSRGNVTTLVHNARNNLTDVYYPGAENYHAAFVYDANDHVIERTVPVRQGVTRKETIERDIHGNVTKLIVERAGAQSTVFSQTWYDLSERPWKMQDEAGRITTLEWTPRGQIKRIVFAPGPPNEGTIVYEYDHENRRTKTTDMAGKDWVTEYDGHGRALRSKDPAQHYLEYAYSGTLTSLVTQFASDGDTIYRQTLTRYDNLKRIERIEQVAKKGPFSKQGSGVDLDYGGDGWLTTRYEYDLADRLTKVYDELNRWTEFQHDNLGRVIAEIHQTGNRRDFTYANHTNLVEELELTEMTATGQRQLTWTHSYDALGRPTAVTDPESQTTTTTYDFAGDVLTNTDPEGNQVVHSRNLLGWVLQTDVRGAAATIQTVTFDHDPSGLLVLATDAEGKQTSLAYDNRGRLTARIFVPESTSHLWHYDAASRVTSLEDPRGTVFYYYYDDPRGLLSSIGIEAGGSVVGDTGPIRYQYDAVGVLTSIEDADSRIVRTHNTLGQVMTEQQWISSEGIQSNYSRTLTSYFDGAARRRKLDYPEPGQVGTGTFVLHYDYDALDRLTTLQREYNSSTTWLSQYQYEGFSRLSKALYANDTGLRVYYDLRNLITTIGHYRALDQQNEVKLFEVERVLDRAGRPTWRKLDYYDPASQSTPYYTDVARHYYDAASRVVDAYHGINITWPPAPAYDATPPNYQSRRLYTLNAADTRNTVDRWEGGQSVLPQDAYTRHPNKGHEYTQAIVDQITHVFTNDAAGNRTQHQRQSGQVTQTVAYQYDAFNRLVSASSDGKAITWRHDPFGRVIEEKRQIGNEPDDVVRYYHDDDSAVLEVSVADVQDPDDEATVRRYVFGPEGPAPFFAQKEAGGVKAFFHTDEQGSVLGLTSDTGQAATVLEHYRYHRDFGEVTVHQGMSGTASTNILTSLFGQPYLWKGAKLDRWMFDHFQDATFAQPGWLLYHMGDREHDPWTAAGLQRFDVGPFAGRAFENPVAPTTPADLPGAGGSAGSGRAAGWPGAFGLDGDAEDVDQPGVGHGRPGISLITTFERQTKWSLKDVYVLRGEECPEGGIHPPPTIEIWVPLTLWVPVKQPIGLYVHGYRVNEVIDLTRPSMINPYLLGDDREELDRRVAEYKQAQAEILEAVDRLYLNSNMTLEEAEEKYRELMDEKAVVIENRIKQDVQRHEKWRQERIASGYFWYNAGNVSASVAMVVIPGGAVGKVLGRFASKVFRGTRVARSAAKGLKARPDVVLSGGRSGQLVKTLTGPPSSAVRGGPGRVFVTNERGQVILDITKTRVKPVIPGQGFGPKRPPTSGELDLLGRILGGGK
ncbi:MAG: RHS repeat protein [Phycisphaerae bacterium]|nr:RHS repeat protein [Phycisphaerae bacterium]